MNTLQPDIPPKQSQAKLGTLAKIKSWVKPDTSAILLTILGVIIAYATFGFTYSTFVRPPPPRDLCIDNIENNCWEIVDITDDKKKKCYWWKALFSHDREPNTPNVFNIEWSGRCTLKDEVDGQGRLLFHYTDSFESAKRWRDYAMIGIGEISNGKREGPWALEYPIIQDVVSIKPNDCTIHWGDYKNGERHGEWTIIRFQDRDGKPVFRYYQMGEYVEGNKHGYWWDIQGKWWGEDKLRYYVHSQEKMPDDPDKPKEPSPSKPLPMSPEGNLWPKECWEQLKEIEGSDIPIEVRPILEKLREHGMAVRDRVGR